MKNTINVLSVRMAGFAALIAAITIGFTALSLTGCGGGGGDGKTVVSIAVTTQPTKTTYTIGDKLDTTGMVVTATYDDGTKEAVTGYKTSGFDTKDAGEKTITVEYRGAKTTFTVTVSPAGSKTLTGIAVTTPPTKTEYNIGEDLVLDGMVVTATYSDGSTAAVTDYDTDTSGYDKTTRGNKTITVTYQGKSTSFAVDVIDPDLPTAAKPTASPAAGAVTSGTTVTLATTTGGAEIWYTTNGTTPRKNEAGSAQYTSPIAITAAVTIKAIAFKDDMNDSEELEAAYTISIINVKIPTENDFTFKNLVQSAANTSGVIITPKQGKSTGTITIYYEGIETTTYAKSTTNPTPAGNYKVTFDVAAQGDWEAETGLYAGKLKIFAGDINVVESVNDLAAFLAGKAANTKDAPYVIALDINTSDFNKLNTTLKDAPDKYVYLDISGSAITTIPNNAFYSSSSGNTTLTGINIPDTVTSIGWNAFRDCTNLTSVDLPDSVTSIQMWAFDGCTSIASLTIPASVTSIEGNAFPDTLTNVTWYYNPALSVSNFRNNLKTVIIHDRVTSIGNQAFSGCTELTSIDIPNSVTTIGDRAFDGCTGLTSITIPNSVTSIGWLVFRDCTGLTSITIPASVTSIDSAAFNNCNASVTWYYNPAIRYIPDYFKKNLKTVIIPDGTTTIGSSAFSGCTGLTSVTIPSSVTAIGSSAFYGCTGLTSVTIPNKVTSIESSAFSGCTGLTGITIPASVTSIESGAFSGTITVTVDAANTAYSSRDRILYSKTAIVFIPSDLTGAVTIPDSITSIGESAFYGRTGLTSITIPNSVTSIGNSAFRGCSKLTSVTIGSGVTSIEEYAFRECTGLTSVTIGSGVTSIGYGAFWECTSLTSVTIPNKVTSIGSNAFYACGLTSVTINSGSIGSNAFSSCTKLASVTLENGVTGIGEQAFDKCSSLASLTIPASVTSVGLRAFRDCNASLNITWYYNSALTAANFKDYLKTAIIPDGTTTVSGFSGCTGITTITIPAGVTRINGFSGCTGLTSVTIQSGSIEINAFENCTSLSTVTLGNGVTAINGNASLGGAFKGCTSLTTITIPASVNTIGVNAFPNTLTNVTWYYNPGVGASAFNNPGAVKTVIIPDGTTTINGNAFYNCTSITSITIPDSVTSIGANAFNGCTGLTSITISANVTSVGNYAFQTGGAGVVGISVTWYYNPAMTADTFKDYLKTVIIPDSVTAIATNAFNGCDSIVSITIPSNVNSIGNNAFNGCTKLTSVKFDKANITITGTTTFIDTDNTTSLKNAYTAGGTGTYTRPNAASTTKTWTKS